jgi:hypothetical protein
VVPAVCCSACVGCLWWWWIPTQKDAKNSVFGTLWSSWHPAVAATNNLMTDLYPANEMSADVGGRRSDAMWELHAAIANCCLLHCCLLLFLLLLLLLLLLPLLVLPSLLNCWAQRPADHITAVVVQRGRVLRFPLLLQ